MLEKNQTIVGRIVDINYEGVGVLKINEYVVFVPFTCIDEEVRVRIVKANKSYAYGILEEIINPSTNRCEEGCEVFHKCGGCSLRHLKYAEECRIKEKFVLETIKHLGKQDLGKVEILPIVPSSRVDGYRNKAQYPIGKDKDGNIQMGFYAPRTHKVIDYPTCHLQPLVFSEIVGIIKNWITKYDISIYDEIKHEGLLRHLYIRMGEVKNEIMVCLVVNGKKLPSVIELIESLKAIDGFTSLIHNVNNKKTNVILGDKNFCLYGKEQISDVICGVEIELSPLSFYQVNREQAEKLYNIAADFADLKKHETLIDLYCGVGTIGLSMAKHVKQLIGIEIIEDAIRNANKNAEINHIDNASFVCGDASLLSSKLKNELLQADCIVVDPPRKGLSEEVIKACSEANPTRIIYISCNAATLARDIELFNREGYKLVKLQTADLFPRTNHVECVCLLTHTEG